MLEEKETVVEKVDHKEEEDIVVNDEETLNHVRETVKEEVIKENSLTEEQQALFKQALEEAAMPVLMNDKDFTLGENELDIRNLSNKNQKQMFFREGAVLIATCRQIMTTCIDISRLLLVICDKIGVEDIIGATDDIIDKLKEQRAELKEVLGDKDKEPKPNA